MFKRTADAAHRQRNRTLALVSIVFFVSGFPALLYQLTWQRSLFLIFGVNIESVTIVVTAFMLGLGLGSLLGGALSRLGALPPLLLFALIEALTCIYGLASLAIFTGVEQAVLKSSPLPAALLALSVVIVPTVLMGATLPVLVRYFVGRSGNVGRSVGVLYYANTLGAAAACLVAAVVLFPNLGMQGVVHLAAGLNFVAAAAALLVQVRAPAPGGRDAGTAGGISNASEPARPLPWDPRRFALSAVLGFLAGYVSLSYEIVWFRVVNFGSGSLAPAFALTLAAFLTGVALGSRLVAGLCRDRVQAGQLLKALAACVLVATAVGFVMVPLVAEFASRGWGWIGWLLPQVVLVAGLWGVALPVVSHIGIPPDRNSGLRLGIVYLGNILGAASGSLVTGFVMTEHLGLAEIFLALALLGLAFVGLLVGLVPARLGPRLAAAGALAGLAGLGIVAAQPLYAHVYEKLLFREAYDPTAPFAQVVENRHGIVTITPDGTIFGNGAYDGALSTDLVNDRNGIIRPFSLSLWHPAPMEVLVVGLSGGAWTRVLLEHPQVEQVTAVEINPGYLEVIAGSPEVRPVLDHPKLSLVIDDGRRWLRRNPDRRFDAVVENNTWHFRAHSTNLLSRTYLEIVARHLKRGGVFLYNTTGSRRAQKTACTVFPHGYRFLNTMVVSNRPMPVSGERWREVLRAYRIGGRAVLPAGDARAEAQLARLAAIPRELAAGGGAGPGVIEPCAQILEDTRGLEIITDDNMGTEWRPPVVEPRP